MPAPTIPVSIADTLLHAVAEIDRRLKCCRDEFAPEMRAEIDAFVLAALALQSKLDSLPSYEVPPKVVKQFSDQWIAEDTRERERKDWLRTFPGSPLPPHLR